MSQLPRVLCLAGPTGAGKTAAALSIAQKFNGEVINTDSRQVYKDFPIITAQPNKEEMAVCAHHLYAFMPTDEKLSAGRFAHMALKKIHECIHAGKLPILVGGTGLYFKTLLTGIAEIPPVPPQITEELVELCAVQGSQKLHATLHNIDPTYAARIHYNDKQRIIRALEVFQATGKTFSWWHENVLPKPMVEGLYLAMDMSLQELTPRLGKRIEGMLAQGAMEEARLALEICPDSKAPGWSGIGCEELYAHLCSHVSFDVTIEKWLHNTRAYAKRQLTWFRADKSIVWHAPQDIQGICSTVQQWL